MKALRQEAIVALINSEVEGPINLGNPQEFTILELLDHVQKIIPSKSKIVHKEMPKDDPFLRRPDITQAKTLLKWEPSISLEEGLKLTADYFRSV